jgi:integrase
MHVPTYLSRNRSGVFYFRIVIPNHIRPLLSCRSREMKVSLRTSSRREALELARCWWVRVQGEFEAMAKETAEERKKQETVEWFGRRIAELKLREQLQKEQREAKKKRIHDELRAKLAPEYGLPTVTPTVAPAMTPVSAVESPVFSEVVKEYFRDRSSAWSQKSKGEHEAAISLFIKITGDVPFRAIRHAEARRYKEVLQQLPPNANKKPEYRGRSVEELIQLAQGKQQISAQTCNNHLAKMSALFAWAHRNDFTDKNYFQGVSVENRTRANEQRKELSSEDMQVLLTSDYYYRRNKKQHKHPYQFWLPLLGMYTGARLEELCQLHIEDVSQVDRIWCISINDEGDKKLKNDASRRVIPLHTDLIDLGFLKLCKALKRRGTTRVFPELRKGRDGYGQTATKWFCRYMKQCGIKEPKKSFHSYRHTVANFLKQKGCNLAQVAELLGHTTGSITGDRYGKIFKPQPMKKLIKNLDYGLDLSHLKSEDVNPYLTMA